MGGEHKCPLCSATFTRPQHVGRHLRAHTGDRPYECKECPLRFARSDLLSRHVNKAHPKPDGQGADKNKDKRGRRKSVSTQNPATGGISASRPPQLPPTAPQPLVHPGHPPELTAFQAQRMYPNHPLLQQNAATSQLWAQPAFTLGHGNQFGTDALGNLVMPAAFAMAPDPVNPHASFDPQLAQAGPHMGLDLAVKKRACDQCNHSKVRCDCADPCARCAHRSVQCTYTKQQRARTSGLGPHLSTAVDPVSNPLSGISPTAGIRNSPLSSSQARMPDALGNVGVAVARPPVPDPQWDASIQHTIGSQAADNPVLHQSPANLAMALTPALTNATSPTATEVSTDRRGSSGNWIMPPGSVSIPTQGDFGGIQMDGIGLASSFHGSTTLFRTRAESLYNDSSASPNYAPTVSSEDDDASSISWTEREGARRRRSSASGHWAGAMDQLHLDDPQVQGVTFDVNGNMQFGFQHQQQQQQPQRHSTFPIAPGDVSANLSRAPSSQDVNFWKLFLDPAALASPDVQDMGFNSLDTPRGLSKSNSMPDLKTPPTVTANYAPLQFPDAMAIPTGPPGVLYPQQQQQGQQQGQVQGQSQQRANSDDTDMDRWRDHIQQRHASFSMSLGPASRKISTGQLGTPSFASSKPGMMRPPPNPLFSNAAMQQTLAPERTPSFGFNAFDPTTPKGNPRTPTAQLLSMYTGFERFERPNNKRMASQTLVPDMFQKRQQTFPPEEDLTDSNASSPRRSSDLPRALPASGLYQSTVPPAKTG